MPTSSAAIAHVPVYSSQASAVAASFSNTLDIPATPLHFDRRAQQHRDLALWKWQLIQPALAYPKHSSARGEQLRQLSRCHHRRSDGRYTHVSLDSLYSWIACYEQQGITALMRRPRCDRGQRQVAITRLWQRLCPLSAEQQQQIAKQLEEHVRSLWAAGAPGFRTVLELGSAYLVELCRATGWHAASLEHCRLSRSYVERHRRYALLAMHDRDARQFFDHMVPRIRRHRDGLQPMELVVGDVHPIDILLTRADGSTVTPRAIAWLDVATQRLHVTLVQLEKGEGIKQVHVAQSFAAMCAAWGLPRQLYLDNGAEYGWQDMLEGFARLNRLTGVSLDTRLAGSTAMQRATVIRARPYNAPAKPIEGIFALLEQQVLCMLPGWVGGDRMRQKTHNVGRAPQPFPGDWLAFHDAFDRALAYYHGRAQPRSRTLQGKSPNEALRDALVAGWSGAPQISAQALQVAFASEDTRWVQGGGYIRWAGQTYFDDALVAHNGQCVRVRGAKWDDQQLFVFDDQDRLICAAQRAQDFAFLDATGAQAQAQRSQHLKRHLQALRANTARLDLREAMQRRTALAEAQPECPPGPRIELTPQLRSMLQAVQGAPQTSTPSTRREGWSQWATPANPYLSALVEPEGDDPTGSTAPDHQPCRGRAQG